jgi:6-phosphofructokinase 1
LGAAATDCLARGQDGVLVGLIKGNIATTPLEIVATSQKPLDLSLLNLAQVLAK